MRVVSMSRTGARHSCTRFTARASAASALSGSGTEPWPLVPVAVAMTL
jgi:hypothetical protein